MSEELQGIQEDAWTSLRSYTNARIALGRTGTAVPLKESLAFRLDHAHARDAVYAALDFNQMHTELAVFGVPVLELHSQAANRQEYLQRPDKGRRLSAESVSELQQQQARPANIAIMLADGLSALAVQSHAVTLLQHLIPVCKKNNFTLAPITVIQQARVAIGDEVAHALKAELAIILIGERPGLSSADSLGAYITYAPRPGLTDEMRNCVSNIRPEGLPCNQAALRIAHLVKQALQLKLSGVNLKDDSLTQQLLSGS